MNHVPPEILVEITSHLPEFDKVTCMCVCNRWKQIIEQHTLYKSVCLYNSASLNKLTTKIKGNPDIARKIEQLVLRLDSDLDSSNFVTFLSSIRCLQKIIFVESLHQLPTNLEFTCRYYNQIESIEDSSKYSMANQVLSSGVCPNLTTLNIGGNHTYLIPLLKNAPALKKIVLDIHKMTFADINLIHKNVTDLQYLEIRGTYILNTGFNDPIEPASSVKECIFTYVTLDTPKNMWEYIYKKYPNVSNLAFDYNGDYGTREGALEGSNQLLQHLGNGLKQLRRFNEKDNDDLFNTLAQYDCHLNYLSLIHFHDTFLQRMVQSDQVRYLKTLVLYVNDIGSFDWLKHLHVLEKLKLGAIDRPLPPSIAVDGMLENCPPTLTTLSFEFMFLGGIFKASTPSNIKRLSLHNVKVISGDLGKSICRYFPKLTKLKLKCCELWPPSLNLSSINLATFQYEDTFFKKPQLSILISTLENKEKRIHQIKKGGVSSLSYPGRFKSIERAAPSFSVSSTKIAHDFKLICRSLGNFVFT